MICTVVECSPVGISEENSGSLLCMEFCNQACKPIILGIEVRSWKPKDFGHIRQCLIVRLMDAGFIAVHPRTRHELVDPRLNAKALLRETLGFSRFTQPAAVYRDVSLGWH